ncbi:hypothetical protein JZ751_015339, partial [Albula glossodonta]
MQRGRLRVEEKELDFEFQVLNVQFNECGRYILTLTVENPLLEDSGVGVQLRVNNGEVLHTSGGSTEPIQQDGLDEVYTCQHSKFVFTLPKGFCKNDKNHDVRLRVEALRLVGEGPEGRTRAGEGFFAIFPRTDAPRINLYASQEEELYRYSGIMALLRVRRDKLTMHCGRLAYAVAFHQSRPALTPSLSLSHTDDVITSPREDDTSKQQTPRMPSPGSSSLLQVPPLILGSPRLPDHLTDPNGVSPRLQHPKITTRSPIPSPRPLPQHVKPEIEPDTRQDPSEGTVPSSPRTEAPPLALPSNSSPSPAPETQTRPFPKDMSSNGPQALPLKH